MKAKYKLFCLINVFDVWPSFLLPVFICDKKFYFEKISKDCIVEFVDADLTDFKGCTTYNPPYSNFFSINDDALYAIGFKGEEYIFGNSTLILDDYNKNTEKYIHDESFASNFYEFMKIVGKPTSSSDFVVPILKPRYRYTKKNVITTFCSENENSVLLSTRVYLNKSRVHLNKLKGTVAVRKVAAKKKKKYQKK